MELTQLSLTYQTTADAVAQRIQELRAQQRTATSSERRRQLQQRIAVLQPILYDSRAIAALLANYYSNKKG